MDESVFSLVGRLLVQKSGKDGCILHCEHCTLCYFDSHKPSKVAMRENEPRTTLARSSHMVCQSFFS